MTDERELRNLQRRMKDYNVKVTYCINEQGILDGAYIVGAKGIREGWLSPLAAAERMREWLWDRAQEETTEGRLRAMLEKKETL